MKYISFPGLGIEPFHINSTAFTVFGQNVAWYGIIICTGLILAVMYAMWRSKTEKIKSDDVLDLALFLVIFGIIGARLYYVIFKFDTYLVKDGNFFQNLGKTILNILNIRNGGLAIYGALIFGFFTIVLVCRHKKIKLLKVLDLVSPACLIGQIIGRWGNFVNVEAFGSETDLPWRMGILTSNFSNADKTGIWTSQVYVHPTFLYESLWNLIGFIIINVLYKKKKFDGQIFFMYISWYGFGRMLIEGLRTDSLMIGPIRISQLVGFVTFVVGTVLLVVSAKDAKNNMLVKETDLFAVNSDSKSNENKDTCDKLDNDNKDLNLPEDSSCSESDERLDEFHDETDNNTK